MPLAGDSRVARRTAVLERVAIPLEAAVVHATHRTGLRAHAGNFAVVGVDHVLLSAHQLGDHAVVVRLPVLPAVANGDDRLDLMLIPQPVDQLVVVVALVGAQATAPFQQLRVALLHLIKQPLRLRLFAPRRRGYLERQRQLVAGVHHQVQQVAEPVPFLLAGALDAPIGIPVAAPVGVFLSLILRQRIAALALGQGVQLLAIQRLYLSQIRQLDLQLFERALEQLIHLPLILAPAGAGSGYRRIRSAPPPRPRTGRTRTCLVTARCAAARVARRRCWDAGIRRRR